jgi:hypothetical protein
MEAEFWSVYFSRDDVHRTTFYVMIIKKEIFYISLYLIIVSQNYQFWYKQTNFYTPVLRLAVLCDWVLRAQTVKNYIHSNGDLDLWSNGPKINRVLPLPQGNHVVKFGKNPIYRTCISDLYQTWPHDSSVEGEEPYLFWGH